MKKLNFKNPKSIAVILLSMALVNIAYVSIFINTEDDANIVNIEPLAVTLTTNSKYRIDISESLKI